MELRRFARSASALAPAAILAALLGAAGPLFGLCGPFTDVSADAFCPFVLEIFTLGITTGTTATTYDPASNVTRLQMAAFLSRTVDGVLKRGSRRTAMRQRWTPTDPAVLPGTTLAGGSGRVEFDGEDLWVGGEALGVLARVRASDGRLLETWTGIGGPAAIVVAAGKVFVTSQSGQPGLTGRLFRVDPSEPAGAATLVATNLPRSPAGLAFDGGRFWTANGEGTVSIITPGATLPWTVTTTAGGYQSPESVLFDGANVWFCDNAAGALLKLSSTGAVLQTVTVGAFPGPPVFDGSNIWVPNVGDSSVSVVRASSGTVVGTLTGNGLNGPFQTVFDGERVLVTNAGAAAVSLWKAADLTPLGSFLLPGTGIWAASDGVDFWLVIDGVPARLVRF